MGYPVVSAPTQIEHRVTKVSVSVDEDNETHSTTILACLVGACQELIESTRGGHGLLGNESTLTQNRSRGIQNANNLIF